MARKEKKYHFIYKTTNILSGRYYIGMHSTNNLDDGYLGSGTRLRYSIRKYGKENHIRKILEFLPSRQLLKEREKQIVNLNEIAKEDCVNLKVGGAGGLSSEEHLKKFVIAGSLSGKIKLKEKLKDPEYKKEWIAKRKNGWLNSTPENKNKIMSELLNYRGTKHSNETKKKMSESSKGMGKGSQNSQYGTMWITNETENKKISKGSKLPEGWRKGRIIKK